MMTIEDTIIWCKLGSAGRNNQRKSNAARKAQDFDRLSSYDVDALVMDILVSKEDSEIILQLYSEGSC